MAIAFAQVKYLSRSKALQATAAAAYRSCSKIYDERTGLTFDYTKKQSPLLYSEIILPENADSTFKNREHLWNTVEQTETRTSSQVAKEIILALPKDEAISNEDKIELARRFAINHFVNKGVAVDINIHDEKDNPHAHILVTTRRIMGSQFDSHKARDLDPRVIRGQVQADRIWGEEWRHFQNNYFLAQGLDLVVDADGIISQIHLGKHVHHSSDREKLDRWQTNQAYKNEAKQIALTQPDSVLEQLTLHHAVFTERDIAKLLNKHINDPTEFQSALIKVRASKELISLGQGDDGIERFTTKNMFELENKLQDLIAKMNNKTLHAVYSKSIETTINSYQLNPGQTNAIHHISNSKGIAIIVGRAGTGKTYALKAAKAVFEKNGYNVQGIALASIAAQGLKESANITSRTIASFNYAVRNNKITLGKQDIIILDEAGMVDNYSLAEVIETVHKAQAKLILVGDHDQLQPIGPGTPFRALVEKVGFAELNTIIRQEGWQAKATQNFSACKVKEALTAYHENGNILFYESSQCMLKLVDDCIKNIIKRI